MRSCSPCLCTPLYADSAAEAQLQLLPLYAPVQLYADSAAEAQLQRTSFHKRTFHLPPYHLQISLQSR